jgi:hypothetical protein
MAVDFLKIYCKYKRRNDEGMGAFFFFFSLSLSLNERGKRATREGMGLKSRRH